MRCRSNKTCVREQQTEGFPNMLRRNYLEDNLGLTTGAKLPTKPMPLYLDFSALTACGLVRGELRICVGLPKDIRRRMKQKREGNNITELHGQKMSILLHPGNLMLIEFVIVATNHIQQSLMLMDC